MPRASIPKKELPELVREPNLIEAIQRDIAEVGLVGEVDNGTLIYLAYSTRVMNEPASIVTRGKSGAGKTTLLTRVAALFPPESKIEAMQMTTAAWFNTPPDFFRHKIFLSGERKHSQDNATRDAGALLRQLLSEKRINRGVSIYDQESKCWTTLMMEREGPIAYAESTTAGSIFEEDLNRLLQLHVDESEGQNRRVMEAIASRYDPSLKPVDFETITRRHHEFQKYLETLPIRRVGIPYAKFLAKALPAVSTETRRIFQQVLTTIEASVVLHQHQREERAGCLVATIEDYALARCLLLPPIRSALKIRDDYLDAKQLREKLGDRSVFTSKDIKEVLKFTNDMGVSRMLSSLRGAGILTRLSEAKGQNPATYKWVGKGGPELDRVVLPTVGDVARSLTG